MQKRVCRRSTAIIPDGNGAKDMYQTVSGLTLRSVNYKEADVLLTVLTDTRGCLTVKARGVRRKGSRLKAACQLFTLSQMTLYESRGRLTLQEAEVQQQFPGLQKSLSALSLASYMAEVLSTEAEDAPGGENILRLALNSLYALSHALAPEAIIKAAFELRFAALSGYAPELSRCAVCGKHQPEHPIAALEAGVLHCRACELPGNAGRQMALSPGVLAAARYVLYCDLKKLFSFSMSEIELRRFGRFCESYLLTRLERGFRTLDFYESVGETK